MEHAKPHPQFSDMYSEVIVSSSAGKNYLLQCSNVTFKYVLSNFLLRLKLKVKLNPPLVNNMIHLTLTDIYYYCMYEQIP